MKPSCERIMAVALAAVLTVTAACGRPGPGGGGEPSPASPSAALPSATPARPGIAWPVANSNPQFAVRVYDVVRADVHGVRQYVVAIDVDAR
jgi:hypothetical protein